MFWQRERAAAGETGSLCGAAVDGGEHVVLAAPRVGSAALQEDAAAKQKGVY